MSRIINRFPKLTRQMSTQKGRIIDYKLVTATFYSDPSYNSQLTDHVNDHINMMIKEKYEPENVVVSGASTGSAGSSRFFLVVPMALREKPE